MRPNRTNSFPFPIFNIQIKTAMRKSYTLFLFALFNIHHSNAQTGQTLNPDQTVTTEHTVTVKGIKIPIRQSLAPCLYMVIRVE